MRHDRVVASSKPEVTVRAVDASDDNELAAVQDAYREAELAVCPDAALHSLSELTSAVRRPAAQRVTGWYVAVDDQGAGAGRVAGAAMVTGKLDEYVDEAVIQVWVPPNDAGRGVGRALADHCEHVAADLDRSVLIGELDLDGPDGVRRRRFAEARSYRWALTEVERRRCLPIPTRLLKECTAEAAPRHRGYTIEAFTGPVPVPWAADFCAVSNRLDLDAPTGRLASQMGQNTPETLADRDAQIIAEGRTRISAFAFDPKGRVVGYTVCVAGPEHAHIEQRGTLIHPDHRGRRLGLAVKAACYRLAQQEFGDRDYIVTTNADENAHMIAINDRLGFWVHSRIGTFQCRPDRC